MNRSLLFFLILAIALILSVTVATADSENAAIVITLDEGCSWEFSDGAGVDLVAEGSVHYVETQNGKWKLTCIGEIVEGLPIDHAYQIKSTDEDPAGTCFTPFGETYKFHGTFSPSGESSFVCQGDLTP